MATWKKVVVSGSAVSQLNNDSGYLVSGQSGAVVLSGSFSGSFQGDGTNLTGISADTLANSLTDGNGIADFSFNGSAGASVAVEVDGSTLSVGSGGVKVADAGITATQLATSIAGDGLSGGAGTALSVNVDGTSITSSGDNLTLAGTTFSSSVDSRIDAAQTQATTNSASLAALDATYATDAALSAVEATASAARSVIAGDVTTNADDISTNAGNISTNAAGIASNSASIAALDTDFATDADLTALSASLSARDTVNEGDIDTLQAVQGALVAATASYASSTSVTNASASLAADVTVNAGDIDGLEAVQGALVAATSSYASSTSVTNASASLAASITTNAGNISTNASDIDDLEAIQGALVAATASYASSTSVTNLSSSLDAAKQDNISVSDTSGQGGIDLTLSADNISGTTVGLGASDNVQFADILATGDVTVQGDLTVQGTTTSINTTNLDVEDKFILLNSGSANPDEGGIVIDEGSGTGHAFLLDSASTRFGFKASLDSTTTGDVTPEAFASAVVDLPAGHSDTSEYQKNGNIKIDSSGNIFIYS
jgi:hypothetical protein